MLLFHCSVNNDDAVSRTIRDWKDQNWWGSWDMTLEEPANNNVLTDNDNQKEPVELCKGKCLFSSLPFFFYIIVWVLCLHQITIHYTTTSFAFWLQKDSIPASGNPLLWFLMVTSRACIVICMYVFVNVFLYLKYIKNQFLAFQRESPCS